MYRITFEQYNLRYEESEKIIADLKGKIEEGNTKIEVKCQTT